MSITQSNVIKRGSVEMKILLFLVILAAIGGAMSYPKISSSFDVVYREYQLEYEEDLAGFRDKYQAPEAQEEHMAEAPVPPFRPTTGYKWITILIYYILQPTMYFILGINLVRRTDLLSPIFDDAFGGEPLSDGLFRPLVTWSIPAGLLMALPLYLSARVYSTMVNGIIASDRLYEVKFPFYKELLGSLGQAVLFFSFFIMLGFPILLWLANRFMKKAYVDPHWVAIAAIVVLSFLYFWVGSPAGATTWQAVTAAVGLAAPMFIMGYVFWRKGLEYSLLVAIVGYCTYSVLTRLA